MHQQHQILFIQITIAIASSVFGAFKQTMCARNIDKYPPEKLKTTENYAAK